MQIFFNIQLELLERIVSIRQTKKNKKNLNEKEKENGNAHDERLRKLKIYF